jgi:hypothetical protein
MVGALLVALLLLGDPKAGRGIAQIGVNKPSCDPTRPSSPSTRPSRASPLHTVPGTVSARARAASQHSLTYFWLTRVRDKKRHALRPPQWRYRRGKAGPDLPPAGPRAVREADARGPGRAVRGRPRARREPRADAGRGGVGQAQQVRPCRLYRRGRAVGHARVDLCQAAGTGGGGAGRPAQLGAPRAAAPALARRRRSERKGPAARDAPPGAAPRGAAQPDAHHTGHDLHGLPGLPRARGGGGPRRGGRGGADGDGDGGRHGEEPRGRGEAPPGRRAPPAAALLRRRRWGGDLGALPAPPDGAGCCAVEVRACGRRCRARPGRADDDCD